MSGASSWLLGSGLGLPGARSPLPIFTTVSAKHRSHFLPSSDSDMFPTRRSSFRYRRTPRSDSRQISRELVAVPRPGRPVSACQISRDDLTASVLSFFFLVGRQGDGLRGRPEVTLTLEPRLPKGCKADRLPKRHPAPDVDPGNSQDKRGHSVRFIHSFPYSPSLFLLIHSFIAVELPPAPLTETALAKVAYCQIIRFLDLCTALDTTAPSFRVLLVSYLLFIRLDSQYTSLS